MDNNKPQTELIQNEIDVILNLWKEKHPKLSIWWNGLNQLIPAIKFLIHSVDYFVSIIEDKIPDGATKKATVIATITVLYNTIVNPLMPIYLKPFSWQIKAIVLNTVSILIDFIVSKYNNGNWNMATNVKNFL